MGVALVFFVSAFGSFLAEALEISVPSSVDAMEKGFANYFWFTLFLAVIVAPLCEEFMYRLLPIRVVKKYTSDMRIIWLVIMLSSTLFGLAHGSLANIFVQGATGLVFGWIYLKGGYWAAVLTHALYNGLVISIFFLKIYN